MAQNEHRKRRDGKPLLITDKATILEQIELLGGGDNPFDEDWLQRLLFDHPTCVPIGDVEPGFDELISVCRELPTKHGSIDNLFMTATGDVIIAETKLWRNPQARREVTSQALDYASCLFEMTFEDFEAAVLKANFSPRSRPKSLYSLFSDHPDALTESAFVDAVSANLERGRIVVLVIGDGIRAETERLASALQSHAGFHFTFALVELAVYRMPNSDGVMVLPRTLANTRTIERGIVSIVEGKLRVDPPKEVVESSNLGSITAEQFFDSMAALDAHLPDRLKAFLSKLDSSGVYPEFKKSLNLKWDPPSGKPINFGYISRNGEVWTDAVHWNLPDRSISQAYIQDLADSWGMQVEKVKLPPNWHVRRGEKVPRIASVANKLDLWIAAIERFQSKIRAQASSDASY